MSASKQRLDMSVQELDNLLKAFRNQQSGLEKCYEISVVTPMFGGSSVAGEVDRKAPIRSASIRGHLRFWWRATRGAAYADAVQLRKAEAEIFGDTEHPSKVKIWVEPVGDKVSLLNVMEESGDTRKPRICKALKPVDYVMFPFKTEQKTQRNTNEKAQYLNPPYRFTLRLRYDAQLKNEQGQEELKRLRDEVEELALWAWINFGGIGARTRRGCGALYCPDFSPSNKTVREPDGFNAWIRNRLKKYGVELLPFGSSREWPTLSDRIEIKPDFQQGITAWAGIIQAYQLFRSRPNSVTNRGRSHWPEADSIRRITGMATIRHRSSATTTDDQEVAFPRAQFGLPIAFKFKDKQGKKENRDPYTTQITPQGEAKDRLASPLILKQIAVSHTQGVGAIIIVNQPRLQALRLSLATDKQDGHREQEFAEEIKQRLDEFSQSIQDRNVYPELKYKKQAENPLWINGKTTTSAIEAFLYSEEVRKWKETNLCKR